MKKHKNTQTYGGFIIVLYQLLYYVYFNISSKILCIMPHWFTWKKLIKSGFNSGVNSGVNFSVNTELNTYLC